MLGILKEYTIFKLAVPHILYDCTTYISLYIYSVTMANGHTHIN